MREGDGAVARVVQQAGALRRSPSTLVRSPLLVLVFAALAQGLGARLASAAPSVGSAEGVAFRRFMHDLVAASGAPADRQVGELKNVFKSHPSARDWLLDGDPDRLSREAGLEAGMSAVVRTALEPQGALGRMKGSLRQVPAGQFAGAVDQVPDAMWDGMARDLDSSVEGFRLTRTAALDMLLSPDGKIEVAGMRDLQWLIRGYFDHVSTEDKRGMLLATLELPPTATTSEQLAAVLHSAGPVAQKMFQLLGQDSRSAEVRAVMQELKSQVRPFSDAAARRVVEQELGIDIDRTFSSFTRVGSATTAQVYRAVLRKNGRAVAIKVLRPGIREKAARDMKTLRLLTPREFERDLVETIGRKVGEELDLDFEARNLEEGKRYNRGRAITVPQRDKAFRSGKTVLVTRFVDGVTLDRPVVAKDDRSRGRALLARGRALERLFGILLEEALTSGVVHADLHGGNLIEVKGWFGKSRLAVVDWGSKVDLPPSQRRGLVALAIAVAGGSPKDAVEALNEISPLPAGRQAALERAVEPLVGRSDGVTRVIDAAIAHGLKLPEGIVGFSRSAKFVSEQISAVNQELDKVDPAHKLKRVSLVRSAAWGGLRAVGRDLTKSALGRIPRPGRAPRVPGIINQKTASALKRMASSGAAKLRSKAAESARNLSQRLRGRGSKTPRAPSR